MTVMVVALALAACTKRSDEPAASNTAALQPAASPAGAASPPLQPANAMPAPGAPGGYACTFSAPGEKPILAHFTVSGATARDDQGVAFTVMADTPTALVLAHARDDAAGPGGDVGAYVVAVDRRDLSMVQAAVAVHAPGALRKGRCVAG